MSQLSGPSQSSPTWQDSSVSLKAPSTHPCEPPTLPSPAPDLAYPAQSGCQSSGSLIYTQPQEGPATTTLFYWGQLDPVVPLLPAPFQTLCPKGPDAQGTTSTGGGVGPKQERSQSDRGFKTPRGTRPEVEQ